MDRDKNQINPVIRIYKKSLSTTGDAARWLVGAERFLERSLASAFSAKSARSSASSNSCCTLRNLAAGEKGETAF